MMRRESRSSVGPPNIIVPRQSGETLTPARPRFRYSIPASRRSARASGLPPLTHLRRVPAGPADDDPPDAPALMPSLTPFHTVSRGPRWGLGPAQRFRVLIPPELSKQRRDRLSFHQLAGLVQVVVDDRVR